MSLYIHVCIFPIGILFSRLFLIIGSSELNKVLIAVVMLISENANSGGYSQFMTKKSFCDDMGSWAAMFYRVKAKGQPKFVPENKGDDPNFALLDAYMLDYAWDVADSEKQAFEGVWAKCMDNFDALIMAKKAGKEPYQALPY